VLGALLLDGDALSDISLILHAEDIYTRTHQKIYEACLELGHRAQRVDEVTVKEELKRRGDLDAIGGEEYLADLVAFVPSAAGVVDYAKIVAEKAIARNLIHYCTNIQAAAYDGSMPGDELLDLAQAQVFGLGRQGDTSLVNIASILEETLQEIWVDGPAEENGLHTGFLELDELTGGLQAGDLIIVAGRPSMGKTTFTNGIVDHAAVVEGKSVVFFSLEVGRKHLVRNMLVARSRVEMSKLRRKSFTPDEEIRLAEAAHTLEQASIFVDDSTMTTAMQLRSKARRIKQKYGLGLVVLDYVQLMETGGGENRQQEVAQLSRALKGLARELEVPVIAISQLNRSVDSREDHRPRMSDLRESGALEQDADLIIFLYREEQYKQTPENIGLAEAIVAKHRNGPTGTVRLRFTGEHMRFDNLATHNYESI